MNIPAWFLACAALLISCQPPLARAAAPSSAVTQDVVNPAPIGVPYIYKHADGEDLKLWVISPKGHTAADRSPALVYFHGGGWTLGKVSAFNRQATYLASRGVVGIQVQYRLAVVPVATPDAGSPMPIAPVIEDAKSSMRWVRSHAGELGIDPNRIGAAGGSAGGHLAAFVGIMDGFDDPQDNLSVSAKPDLLILFNPAVDLGAVLPCCHQVLGEDYKLVSPTDHVHPGIPPTLILQGAEDRTVLPATIQQFAAKLKRDGVRCDLVLYSRVGHGFFNRGEEFYETLERTDAFLASLGWVSGPPDEVAIHRLPEEAPQRDVSASLPHLPMKSAGESGTPAPK